MTTATYPRVVGSADTVTRADTVADLAGTYGPWGGAAMTTLAPVKLHHVVGDPGMVVESLNTAYESGRLVSVIDGQLLPDGRLHVQAELRALPAPEPSRWQRFKDDPTWAICLATFLLSTSTVGLVLYGLVMLATAVAVWVSANAVVIGAVLVALVLFAIGGGSKCVGLHCGGCGSR